MICAFQNARSTSFSVWAYSFNVQVYSRSESQPYNIWTWTAICITRFYSTKWLWFLRLHDEYMYLAVNTYTYMTIHFEYFHSDRKNSHSTYTVELTRFPWGSSAWIPVCTSSIILWYCRLQWTCICTNAGIVLRSALAAVTATTSTLVTEFDY